MGHPSPAAQKRIPGRPAILHAHPALNSIRAYGSACAAAVYSPIMVDLTRILDAISAGDRQAADQLLPLVYDELRRLAAAKLSREKLGQTLDATALVHEA